MSYSLHGRKLIFFAISSKNKFKIKNTYVYMLLVDIKFLRSQNIRFMLISSKTKTNLI